MITNDVEWYLAKAAMYRQRAKRAPTMGAQLRDLERARKAEARAANVQGEGLRRLTLDEALEYITD